VAGWLGATPRHVPNSTALAKTGTGGSLGGDLASVGQHERPKRLVRSADPRPSLAIPPTFLFNTGHSLVPFGHGYGFEPPAQPETRGHISGEINCGQHIPAVKLFRGHSGLGEPSEGSQVQEAGPLLAAVLEQLADYQGDTARGFRA
jgi:hypothetical protein